MIKARGTTTWQRKLSERFPVRICALNLFVHQRLVRSILHLKNELTEVHTSLVSPIIKSLRREQYGRRLQTRSAYAFTWKKTFCISIQICTRAVRNCLIRSYAGVGECLVNYLCLDSAFKVGHSDQIPVIMNLIHHEIYQLSSWNFKRHMDNIDEN